MVLAKFVTIGALVLAACWQPEPQADAAVSAAVPAPLALTGAAAGAAAGAPARAATETELRAAASTITAALVQERVSFLASDALRGRDTPSPGLERAAEYIAAELQSLGVEPAGENGTYVQRWPYPIIALDADRTVLEFRTAAATHRLSFGSQFAAEPATPGRVDGSVVFVPDAANAGDLGAARGRVAAVMLMGPTNRNWSVTWNNVRAAARAAGVGAVVFILDPSLTEQHVSALSRQQSAARRIVGEVTGIPTAFVSYDAARPVFREAGVDIDAARRQPRGSPAPIANLSATVATPVDMVEDARPPNVVGMIRGSDPELRDTYVVLSAHMDHVGARQQGGDLVIYNGADDNASGTTGVMMVARALAALETPPARSVIFLLVSGEEKGLLGSRWFVENPTVPIEGIVANMNLDMIGRNNPDTVVVLGQEYSSLGPLVRRVNEAHPELELTVAPDLWPQEGLFFRSDQFNFARKEIPNLFFFTGLHEDYHRPSDTADKVDPDKIARIARLVFYATHEIASDARSPEWTPDGLAEVRMMVRGR